MTKTASALDGRVAIVTGGTGGLGPSVVKALLDAGAKVDAPHRRDGALERIRADLPGEARGRLDGGRLDLVDEMAVTRYFDAVASRHGRLDVLVNVAGGFEGGRTVAETPWSVWQTQLDVNLKTTVLSCKAAVPHLLAGGGKRAGGAIVNVASRAAVTVGGHVAAYAASKRAVLQLTEALAAELRAHDVTVNAVLPSVIDTPANHAAMGDAQSRTWVDPAEIARVILFLIGPDARVISGAAIPVYGRGE